MVKKWMSRLRSRLCNLSSVFSFSPARRRASGVVDYPLLNIPVVGRYPRFMTTMTTLRPHRDIHIHRMVLLLHHTQTHHYPSCNHDTLLLIIIPILTLAHPAFYHAVPEPIGTGRRGSPVSVHVASSPSKVTYWSLPFGSLEVNEPSVYYSSCAHMYIPTHSSFLYDTLVLPDIHTIALPHYSPVHNPS